MKNTYEIRGDITLIFIDSKKYGRHEILIDTDDLEKVGQYTWSINKNYKVKSDMFYAKNSKLKKEIHAYIMDSPKDLEVDHINRNGLDNRKINLRITTRRGNSENRSDNKSGMPGVFWYKKNRKWIAYAKVNGIRKHIGYFNCKHEAAEARRKFLEEKGAV